MAGGANQCLFTRGTPELQAALYMRAYWSMLEQMISDMDPGHPLEVIELGAGRGTLAQYCQDAGHRVTLLDADEAGFVLARENWKAHKMPLPRFVVADCEATELPAESYDVVCSIGLLEHFVDPVPTLRESVRLLKPGGLMFHIIVSADGGRRPGGDMVRTDYTCEQWAGWMAEMGFAARCSPTFYQGVQLLTAIK
jgi:ubiquinone/menaquinone biosynthesis C-methylase UbiE